MDNFSVLNGVNLKFSNRLYNFCKGLYRSVTPKYAFMVSKPLEPCVYLCRHLNLHGALTIGKCATFDMQTYVLHVFTNRKTCFEQFYNYTFSRRCNRRKAFALLPSFICSLFVPLICNKEQTIPVYRNGAEAVKTIKASLSALKSGKCLLIFPNVDYTNSSKSEEHNIYDGFLLLEKFYFKSENKHLKFIPLIIDDRLKTVCEKPAISFTNDIPFEKEMPIVTKKIIDAIF